MEQYEREKKTSKKYAFVLKRKHTKVTDNKRKTKEATVNNIKKKKFTKPRSKNESNEWRNILCAYCWYGTIDKDVKIYTKEI